MQVFEQLFLLKTIYGKTNYIENMTKVSDANFYAVCPSCNKWIAFQGIDIQYYQPIGSELITEDGEKKELCNTSKIIICPHCKTSSKAKDMNFILNDF